MDDSNSKMYINKYGDKIYKNSKREYHRIDGPALEYANRGKYWYKEGKCHRVDGPAVEWPNGDKLWYKEDKYHREDGPAVEYSDGDKYWYILNKRLKEKDFNSWIFRIQKCI